MDQYLFDVSIVVVGMDIDKFLTMLKVNGFDFQADEASKQIKEQLENL